MTLNDDDLAKAQAGNVAATQRLFAEALPGCARIATSLTGSTAAGKRVLKTVVDRAPDQLLASRDAEEATRWFTHQTVLLSREEKQPSGQFVDSLVSGVGGPDVVQYQALIAGLRKLPRQQQEAFILHNAQHWNVRLCSIAMDCSTEAVQTHLDEATRTLTPLVGHHLPALQKAMEQVHKTQPIDLPQSPRQIATMVLIRRSWQKTLVIAGWIALLVLIAVLVAAAIYVIPRIKL